MGYTREQLAARAEITPRYLAAIESNEKRPKIDVLGRLILSLGMCSERIFRPEQPFSDSEAERLLRLLSSCSERDRRVITAIIDTMLDTRSLDEDTEDTDTKEASS